jgi:NAD-dependent histone deacetylase SIR2
MGFFAVTPIHECPHCIPENILEVSEFKDITVATPCADCGHTKENWVCLKSKYVGCSRYVESHMVAHNEKFHNPIALSFADFSFWCYECDSYVTSKLLNHVNYFYPQKFGVERANPMQEYAIVKNSKADPK